MLTVLVGFAAGFASIWSWTTAALLAWNIYRARQELTAVFLDATRLDKQAEKKLERAAAFEKPFDKTFDKQGLERKGELHS
jgi:hypothetical protein